MQEARKIIKDKIDLLPLEKLGKVISYVDFLAQEPEAELVLSPDDEAHILATMEDGDYVNSDEVYAVIEALPND